jgi:outer membrane protein W
MKCNYHIKAIIILFVLAAASAGTFAQNTVTKRYMIVRSTPSYTLQFNIDYNQSVLELSGAYNDDYQSETVYDGETFGSDKGYGASVLSKLILNKRGDIRFTQSLTYNRILSYTFGDKKTVADNGKANYNCFTGGLGIEYNFTPAHKFKIYVGAELNASMINGDIKVWFENRGGTPYNEEYKVTNSFRLGYGFIIGSEFVLNDNFGLNVGARLLNVNALLKEAKGTNADPEFKLRDAADPNLIFAGNNNKSFSFYSIMAGVNFYFGVKEKRYKLN